MSHCFPVLPRIVGISVVFAVSAAAAAAASSPATTPRPKAPHGSRANPVLRASTGHVSNYDEAKIGTYTLPDPLLLANGTPVRDAGTWTNQRRGEILALYNREIYGRVPARAPEARAEVVASGEPVLGGAAVRKHIVIHFGPDNAGPHANVVMYLPAHAAHPVPLLLHVTFGAGLPSDSAEPPSVGPANKQKSAPDFAETGPVTEILRRGYGYATFRYTDVQPDDKTSMEHGVVAEAFAPGQTARAADEWGAITAWAWAASRVMDYLQTDHDIDGHRVAIIGHSRLGKTALWASALDPRFALAFASCSGEMGAALSRRDYGETIDDMVQHFPWWFAANFQKYSGHWNQMPVDAHMLIALSAPRPVFISGGTEDQWADPKGEFLAEAAASPVYQLLGVKGLGTTEFPPVDTPVIAGNLGWIYHTGPHAILPEDWKAFLDFADQHLK